MLQSAALGPVRSPRRLPAQLRVRIWHCLWPTPCDREPQPPRGDVAADGTSTVVSSVYVVFGATGGIGSEVTKLLKASGGNVVVSVSSWLLPASPCSEAWAPALKCEAPVFGDFRAVTRPSWTVWPRPSRAATRSSRTLSRPPRRAAHSHSCSTARGDLLNCWNSITKRTRLM